MAVAADHTNASERPALSPWFLILLGLVALYVPTGIDLFRGLWRSDEYMHGPIILATSCWLLYRRRAEILPETGGRGSPAAGWVTLAVGLLLYVVGRSQDILMFEVGSLIWVVAACVLLLRGTGALRVALFPLFFMIFMIPLPGPVVDTLTMPMKMAVSYVTEQVLYSAGYPIARIGVILHVGQYQLLVADACAGLHTLFSLEALGLLYLNLVQHNSMTRNVILAILIVPISFTANVVRVMTLTLVTYHLGDAAGQGFLHGFAGMVLFVTALLLIISVDSALQAGVKRLGRVAQ